MGYQPTAQLAISLDQPEAVAMVAHSCSPNFEAMPWEWSNPASAGDVGPIDGRVYDSDVVKPYQTLNPL